MIVTKTRIEDNEAWITVKSGSEWVVIHIKGRVKSVNMPSPNNLEVEMK